jgi:hydrogenase small subunit
MMTRRDALKKIYKVVIAVGASSFLSFEDLLAIDNGEIQKPDLVWLHGTSCSGCSTSFLNVEGVPLVDILTQYTNIIFHPDVSLATGHQVTDMLERAEEYKNFLFVFEGSIPVGMPHACMVGNKPMTYWVDKLASNSLACVGAGTCASFGGITAMEGMVTGTKPLGEYLEYKGIKKPVINLPNCPMKPEHLLYVLFYFLKTKKLPPLDKQGRPKRFYAHTIHERCVYYSDYQENNFAKKIGDDGCLFKLGCQGIVTKNDCVISGHNDNTNICIRAGHPCIGCASENFPRQIMMRSYDDKRIIKNFKIIS